MNQDKDFLGREPIGRLLLKLAFPTVAAQVINMLYNIVDRIYIARIHDIGTTALGAVGLCFPIIMIITAFSNLFGSGGAPIFSINRGKGDSRTADMIMNTAFTMLCGSAAVLMLIGFLFARPLLTLFGASDDALVYAYPYLMIYLLGTLPSMIATGMNPFINAQGYAIIGMLSVTVGAVANIILDPIFIFVLDMGIKGAAIATIISQILSALLVFYFLHGKSELKVRWIHINEISECTRHARDIISLGSAGFIMQLTNSLVSICCNNVLSVTGGDIYISVMTIISSVRQMVETPIHAINEGTSPVLSYNYGAGNLARVRKACKISHVLCLVFATTLTGLMMIFPGPFAGIFSNDPSLLHFSAWALPIYLAGGAIFGAQISCQQSFMSLGQAKISLILACLRKVILLAPLIYIFPVTVGKLPFAAAMAEEIAGLVEYPAEVFSIFFAEPVSDILAAVCTSATFYVFYKRHLKD